jgi:ABC-type phosphate/phosphonate transport system substrate-binding protein
MAGGLFLLVSAVALLASALFLYERDNRIGDAKKSDEMIRALLERIEGNRKGGEPIDIARQEMDAIMRLTSPGEGAPKHFTLATAWPERGPDRVVPAFGPFTYCLQTSLWRRAHFDAAFDLRLYPSEAIARANLGKDKAHLVRLDPAGYMLGRWTVQGLIPIVQELYGGAAELHGAIVTHPQSGITTLNEVRDLSFAFGEPGSALGWYLPRAELAKAGLRAGNLRSTNLSLFQALGAVRKQQVQAGVVMWDDYENLAKAGLRLKVLRELRCPAFVWVATPKLGTNVVVLLRDTLLSLRDQKILTPMNSHLTGFSRTRLSDYEALEQQIQNAEAFGTP